MKIKAGGKTESLKGKIKSIRIALSDSFTSSFTPRTYELWINEDSLSYLSIEEILDLKDEINTALKGLSK